MRKSFSAAFFVGLLTLAAIAAFVWTYGRIESRYTRKEGTHTVYALFDDVTGLAERSQVHMSGVPVGFVESISLDSETSRAKVTLRVDDEVKLHAGLAAPGGGVKNGASVSRVQASFIGDYHLALAPGIDGPLLGEGDRIPNAISDTGIGAAVKEISEVTKLFPKIDRIVDDVGRITAAAAEVYGGDPGVQRLETIAMDMQEAVGNIRTISEDIRGFVSNNVITQSDSIARIVANVERFTEHAVELSAVAEGRAGRILTNLEIATKDVRELVAGSRDEAADAISAARRVLERVEGAMGGVDNTLSSVGEIARKIDEGQGTIGKLVNDDTLVTGLEDIVEDAGEMVGRVSRLRARVGLRTEYNVLGNSLKSYVSLRLVPKEDKFYLIEIVDDPRGKTTIVDRSVTSDDPLRPGLVHETVAETADELKFSLQFGKRWYFVTGRFGIVESTGGVGLDFEFLEDTLRFTFDLFDFDTREWPRLKWLASWEFMEHVYVAAGVDDIINDGGRDYFFGLGVTFTDDDLKSLLTLGGIPSVGK